MEKTKIRNKKESKNYNLREICKLFNILGEFNDIKNVNFNAYLNDKSYTVDKENNNLTINCIDGRLLKVKIDSEKVIEPDSDYYFIPHTVKNGTVSFEYDYPNGDKLRYKNDFIAPNPYDIFKTINERMLKYTYDLKYISPLTNTEINCSDDFSYFTLNTKDKYSSFRFTSDGIVYNNLFLVSHDGTKLLKYKNKNVPNYNVLKEFDVDKKINELQNMVSHEETLNENILIMLHDAINNLDTMEENVKKYLDFYENNILLCQMIVYMRNNLLSNINKYTFTKQELLYINKMLIEKIKEKYLEQREELMSKKYTKK